MTCEKYQSLPSGVRSPEDQLVIELAKVSYIHMHYRSETESTHSSPKSGADVPGAMQSSSESMGTIICSVDVKWNSASIVAVGHVQSSPQISAYRPFS